MSRKGHYLHAHTRVGQRDHTWFEKGSTRSAAGTMTTRSRRWKAMQLDRVARELRASPQQDKLIPAK